MRQLRAVNPREDLPEHQMAFVDENKTELGDDAPREGLFRANLNRRRRVGEIVLALDDADVGNSSLTEGLYRLLDEV
jgi:hypothetical protein